MQPVPIPRHHAPTGRTARLRLPATPMWSTLLIPGNWQILLEPVDPGDNGGNDVRAWVVPDPVLIRHSDGVGGVTRRRVRDPDTGRVHFVADPSKVLASWREQGAIEIPLDYEVTAHGVTHSQYILRYQTAAGLHHCWAYERPIPGPGRTRIDVDHRARCVLFASWAADYMGGVHPHVLTRLRAIDERARAACRAQADRNAVALQRLQVVERRMRAMGWLEHDDGEIRPCIGSVERTGDPSGLGAVPADFRAYLATLSPAQRARLLSSPAAGAAPTPQRIETPPSADAADDDGAVTL